MRESQRRNPSEDGRRVTDDALGSEYDTSALEREHDTSARSSRDEDCPYGSQPRQSDDDNDTEPTDTAEQSFSRKPKHKRPRRTAPVNGETKRYPFSETMAIEETWFRYMPTCFPFGETPFMEEVLSSQIDEDLSRGNAPDSKGSQDSTAKANEGTSVERPASSTSSIRQSEPSLRTWKWALPPLTGHLVQQFKESMQTMAVATKRVREKRADSEVPSDSSAS